MRCEPWCHVANFRMSVSCSPEDYMRVPAPVACECKANRIAELEAKNEALEAKVREQREALAYIDCFGMLGCDDCPPCLARKEIAND